VPPITFGTEEPSFDSDPFTRRERELLLNTALDYRSPPSYSNVTPEERDRWNAQLAQYLGKPKEEVSPDDWEELQRTWKFASIISTALDAGWRAKLVERLETIILTLTTSRSSFRQRSLSKTTASGPSSYQPGLFASWSGGSSSGRIKRDTMILTRSG
jgi:hypothetical protein